MKKQSPGKILQGGGIVVFPTDTVTGIGCRAGDASAVRRIFALKGREKGKPLILFVSSIAQAEKYTGRLPERVRRLLRELWPGPFTAILPVSKKMVPGVGIRKTVGIRIPGHAVPLSLLKSLGEPMATTSANLAGQPPDIDAEKAGAGWVGRVSVIAGRSGNVPSTVADLTRWPPVVLRAGAVSEGKLRKLCGGE